MLGISTIEIDPPKVLPTFLSRGQSFRPVIGDAVVLPCRVKDLGEFQLHLQMHLF